MLAATEHAELEGGFVPFAQSQVEQDGELGSGRGMVLADHQGPGPCGQRPVNLPEVVTRLVVTDGVELVTVEADPGELDCLWCRRTEWRRERPE